MIYTYNVMLFTNDNTCFTNNTNIQKHTITGTLDSVLKQVSTLYSTYIKKHTINISEEWDGMFYCDDDGDKSITLYAYLNDDNENTLHTQITGYIDNNTLLNSDYIEF